MSKKWQPMEKAQTAPLHKSRIADIKAYGVKQGFSEADTLAMIEEARTAETWMNNTFVATVVDAPIWQEGWPAMKQCSIRRVDRKTIHDWRQLQRVKADIFGEHAEAVELYPSAARVVDTANSCHLFVLPEGSMFPFGWAAGLQSDEEIIEGQQRPGALDGIDGSDLTADEIEALVRSVPEDQRAEFMADGEDGEQID